MPWAPSRDACAIGTLPDYREALANAGFELLGARNRRDFALEFAKRMQTRMQSADGPPPLGLHLMMGPAAPEKYRNMVAGIAANDIAPVELLARKPG